MHFRMQFYTQNELSQIIYQASQRLNKVTSNEASFEIAKRSRGTPRIALRLLRRVRDFAEVANETIISLETTQYALDELGVDELGFDEQDIKLMELLLSAKGKPLGLNTIGAVLSEDESTIEDVLEPYLIANGYIERTARGRVATQKAYEHFKFQVPQTKTIGGLFE